jgi:hypothetical protein
VCKVHKDEHGVHLAKAEKEFGMHVVPTPKGGMPAVGRWKWKPQEEKGTGGCIGVGGIGELSQVMKGMLKETQGLHLDIHQLTKKVARLADEMGITNYKGNKTEEEPSESESEEHPGSVAEEEDMGEGLGPIQGAAED